MKKSIKIISIFVFTLLFSCIFTTEMTNVNAAENNKAIITFIDDDDHKEFLSIQKPILDKYEIKSTLAVITNDVGGEGSLTLDELHQLQNEGFDIVSHTATHSADVFKYTNDLSKVSDDAILKEYKDSQDWLKNNGFNGYDTVVYPWGAFSNQTERYLNLASKYYKYGVNSSPYEKTINNMYLNRLFLNKNTPIDNFRKAVDKTIQNNGWLIIGTHSMDSEISSEYLEECIQYVKSKNVEILPFSQACNFKYDYIYQENKKMSTKKIIAISLGVLFVCGGIGLYIYKRKKRVKSISVAQ